MVATARARQPNSWRRRAGVVAVLLAMVTIVSAPAHATDRPGPSAPSDRRAVLVDELQQASRGRARVATKPETGAVSLLGGSPDAPLTTATSDDHGAAARDFVDHVGSLYGIDDPARQLREDRRHPTAGGGTAVRFGQRVDDIPVVGGEVAVQVGPDGRILSSLGDTVPHATADTTPTVTADAAVAIGVAQLGRGRVSPLAISPTTPELWIYDPVLFGAGGPPGSRLVWRLEVTAADTRELVLVDAHTGDVALHFDQNAEARFRSVCNNNNVVGAPQTCTAPVRNEGGPATGISDVDNAYAYAGATYDFFAAQFGRDSIDGAGLPLKSTVRYCPPSGQGACPYGNAFWNGSQMVYGSGYANADDVVGHELTHGLTQYTSRLFYLGQTGAVNESMSDVMGELVDQTDGVGTDTPAVRWLMGEDLPIVGIGGTGAVRSMSDPAQSLVPQADRMTSPDYYGGHDDNAGVHRNSGVGNKAAFLITDGGSFNGQVIAGLGATKAARLYYQVEVGFLSSASVYADLGNALVQACTNLVGSVGFTTSDCTEVAKAVTATEMLAVPIAPGSSLPTAPVCPAGQVATDLFTDDMENAGSGNWASSTLGGTGWSYDRDYVRHGAQSLYGPDLGIAGDLTIRRTANVVPPVGATTYLRFEHAYQFDFDSSGTYDGGLVQYSTNGGAGPWADAGPLITDNGYTGTIRSGFGNLHPGASAFVANSPGYQSTRINLSPLAGQNVMFRFLVASDSSFGQYGWFLDDVRVYTCAATGPPGAPTGVTATAMNSAAHLRWQPPATVGGGPITSYRITATPGGTTLEVAGSTTQAVFPGLTNGTPYSFTVEAENTFGPGPPSTPAGCTPWIGPGYHPLSPGRLLDSRAASPLGPWGPGQTKNLTVAGVAGVPAGATAVVLNVTAVNPTAASHLVVWPAGVTRPIASNLNFSAGEVIANLVQVGVGASGQLSIFNNAGTTDIVADVVGYYDDDGSGSTLTSETPFRVLDSRTGVGGYSTPWTARQAREVQVTGVPGSNVPASGVGAVILNVTAVGPSAGSHLTVWPAGESMPNASSLNVPAGRTLPNLVIAKVGATGRVSIYNNSGAVDVLVDVVGFFTAEPAGGRFTAVTPSRVLDTRAGTGGYATPWTGGLTRPVTIAGRGGVPPSGATAVVLNTTAVFPSADSHLTVWDAGAARPTASNLNLRSGDVVPNLVVVKLGTGGAVDIFNNAGTVDVVADVVGYYAT